MSRSKAIIAAGILFASVLLGLALAPIARAGDTTSIAFPEGYRSWTFLHGSVVPASAAGFAKSPCEKPCTNGIFYFYANELAMKGLRTGTYPDGAQIAEELLELRVGEKGSGDEGRRALVAVMVKDSKRFAGTDGWGYANFNEGSKTSNLDAAGQQRCHQCHVSRKDQGYVFSKYLER